MKSKLHTWAEEAWSCLVITAAAFLFLYMVFAWVVIICLSVAESAWFLMMIPTWFVDVWALGRVIKYANRKWGENGG